MPVNKNERKLFRQQAIARIAPKLSDLRARLRMKQAEFGEVCGVSAVQVSRWEKQLDLPNPKALMAIAKLAPDDEQEWWLSEAGVETLPVDESETRLIPILKDSAAAGTTRAINENEVAYHMPVPSRLLPRGGKLVGIPVLGDSMSPILETGYVAFVNTAAPNPAKLAGKMVAARDTDGVTIKWLRKQREGMFLLVPQHTSPRHQVQILQDSGEWSIVGEVVSWMGFPPQHRR